MIESLGRTSWNHRRHLSLWRISALPQCQVRSPREWWNIHIIRPGSIKVGGNGQLYLVYCVGRGNDAEVVTRTEWWFEKAEQIWALEVLCSSKPCREGTSLTPMKEEGTSNYLQQKASNTSGASSADKCMPRGKRSLELDREGHSRDKLSKWALSVFKDTAAMIMTRHNTGSFPPKFVEKDVCFKQGWTFTFVGRDRRVLTFGDDYNRLQRWENRDRIQKEVK